MLQPAVSLSMREDRWNWLLPGLSKDFGKQFLDIFRRNTEQVFQTKEFVEITDVMKCNYTNNPTLMAEKNKVCSGISVLLRENLQDIVYRWFQAETVFWASEGIISTGDRRYALTLDRFALIKVLKNTDWNFEPCWVKYRHSSHDRLQRLIVTCNESAAEQLDTPGCTHREDDNIADQKRDPAFCKKNAC